MAKKDDGAWHMVQEEPKKEAKKPVAKKSEPPAATGGRVRVDPATMGAWQPTGNGPRDRSGSPTPVVSPVVEETDPAGSEEEEPLGGEEPLSDECPVCGVLECSCDADA